MHLNTPPLDLTKRSVTAPDLTPACVAPRCRTARRVLWVLLTLTALPWLCIAIPTLCADCSGFVDTFLAILYLGGIMLLFAMFPQLILLVASYSIRTRSSSLWLVVHLPLCLLSTPLALALIWEQHDTPDMVAGAVQICLNIAITAEMVILYPLFRLGEHLMLRRRSC